MKLTLSWLKEHLDTDADLDTIVETLTMIGLEVDGVEDRATGLRDFVVAEVLEAVKHPDADKLKVCTVHTGSETFNVVCGAPNARTGMKGVFAREGMYIPGIDVTLKKARIRGVESSGMLLSEREMGLSDEHDGIVDLPAETLPGAAAIDVIGLNDPVIDVAITPNRGDCLGVRGIARDLAAAGLGALRPIDAAPVPGAFKSPVDVLLDFDAETADACPYFVGRYVRGVTNGPSPKWVQDKLSAIGLRPISALVDITNLMTMEYGRPMHVFDAAKVAGNVHARLARAGETLMALDGKAYTLDAEMTVIADDEKAEAIAGIMGGEASSCTETTTDVFIETAYFDPVRTAMSGRRLNLQSDARYRFERGVDPSFMVDATEIATRWMLDWCGGEASDIVIAGAEPETRTAIDFRPERVRTLAGVDVAEPEMERILGVLGFDIERGDDLWKTRAPAWRHDIVGEACLVEEVVRIHGYHNIPTLPLDRLSALPTPALDPAQKRHADARRELARRGMVEAVTYSFMSGDQADLFGGVPDTLRLINPISADLDVMRPSILPNLITACGRNADRGFVDADLFEVGPQFRGDAPEDEDIMATGLRSGKMGPRHWDGGDRPVDVYDAKADALAVLAAVGAPASRAQVNTAAPAWYHPGRSGSLRLGPNVLAWFGELHPGILAKLGVKGPVVGFEVFLDHVPAPKVKKTGKAKPHLTLSALQPVERDFAFVVDADTPAEKLRRAAAGADKKLITAVSIFDVFQGASLGAGKKSIALSVTLQPTEKTLTDDDIDAVATRVIGAVVKATSGELRG